ncbi:hypothetical protein CLF_111019 [Clonorchis sinensis]|uniref:Uncharacterized protein n=1 Tax=Clonorchis sinensis TaxID=79923 RepID=G7YLC9_CLOSI|nr:hypothetical protein CLF_111019 [Clonorchis sinensis]
MAVGTFVDFIRRCIRSLQSCRVDRFVERDVEPVGVDETTGLALSGTVGGLAEFDATAEKARVQNSSVEERRVFGVSRPMASFSSLNGIIVGQHIDGFNFRSHRAVYVVSDPPFDMHALRVFRGCRIVQNSEELRLRFDLVVSRDFTRAVQFILVYPKISIALLIMITDWFNRIHLRILDGPSGERNFEMYRAEKRSYIQAPLVDPNFDPMVRRLMEPFEINFEMIHMVSYMRKRVCIRYSHKVHKFQGTPLISKHRQNLTIDRIKSSLQIKEKGRYGMFESAAVQGLVSRLLKYDRQAVHQDQCEVQAIRDSPSRVQTLETIYDVTVQQRSGSRRMLFEIFHDSYLQPSATKPHCPTYKVSESSAESTLVDPSSCHQSVSRATTGSSVEVNGIPLLKDRSTSQPTTATSTAPTIFPNADNMDDTAVFELLDYHLAQAQRNSVTSIKSSARFPPAFSVDSPTRLFERLLGNPDPRTTPHK